MFVLMAPMYVTVVLELVYFNLMKNDNYFYNASISIRIIFFENLTALVHGISITR